MSAAADQDEAVRIAYQIAVDALPPLPRVIFLLHRVDDLPYEAIAGRLTIGVPAVQSGLAQALSMMARTLDGDTPDFTLSEPLAEAQAGLRQRHRRYCEASLGAISAATPIAWDDDCDDDATVTQVVLRSMPAAALDTLLLNQLENLTYAQIARRTGTFRWIVRCRMLRAIRHIAARPMTFEEWLVSVSR